MVDDDMLDIAIGNDGDNDGSNDIDDGSGLTGLGDGGGMSDIIGRTDKVIFDECRNGVTGLGGGM